MSHFCALVLVPNRTQNINAAVSRLLDPWDQAKKGEDGKWDWYVVGGRWTGVLTGYDPRKDPRNQEPCTYCKASGKRTDAVGRANPVLMERCNGCSGTGTAIKFSFVPYEGDVQPVKKIPADFVPFAVLTPDGKWHEVGQMHMFAMVSDSKNGTAWKEEVDELLAKHSTCKAVVVDCHV